MACTCHIPFDFELQVHFSKKKPSLILQIYLTVILLNRNVYWVMDILEILQKMLMYFTLEHHIKLLLDSRVFLMFCIQDQEKIYGSLTMAHSILAAKL